MFSNNIIHKSFLVSIFIKGLDGFLELIGGISFLIINPTKWYELVKTVTRVELLEDPNDIVANYLISISSQFNHSFQIYASIFLLSHGLIKLFIIFSLLKKKMWAYPVALIVFSIFAFYQIYLYILNPRFSLMILTIVDALVIIITYMEYKRVKSHISLDVK